MTDEIKPPPSSGPAPAKRRTSTWEPGPPTHNLCVKEPRSKAPFHQIGVGWLNNKGQVNIQLDAGTCLRWDDDLTIYLFPKGEQKER